MYSMLFLIYPTELFMLVHTISKCRKYSVKQDKDFWMLHSSEGNVRQISKQDDFRAMNKINQGDINLCVCEINRCFLLGRKVMTNLDSIFKSRDIILPTKVRLVKAMVFPVVIYGCESWTAKKAEHWRIDAFELWCWRRLLRVSGLQGDPTSPF